MQSVQLLWSVFCIFVFDLKDNPLSNYLLTPMQWKCVKQNSIAALSQKKLGNNQDKNR